MARYDKDHKRVSRERIIEAAGRRFKIDGIDGSGVAVLMKDAGLTNGAFYGHFESKDDLVSTTVGEELRAQRELLAGLEPGLAGFEQFIRAYLSVEHRDDLAGGCPSAALLDEIGRCTDRTRQSYSDGIVAIIDDLAACLGGAEPDAARVTVLGVFASMVGSIQLSRALTDRELADAVLAQGVRNALILIGAAGAPR
jgi:TetR/AcrR family transcriptional regulator, transcriptional repressor for nem operon